MNPHILTVSVLLLASCCAAGAEISAWPLTTLRLACRTEGELRQIIDITGRHKGSFDEYWITYTHPWFDDKKVMRSLERGAAWVKAVAAAGIRAGDQQGMTLGHGSPLLGGDIRNGTDALAIPEDAFAVGRDGARLSDFCPRSPFVLAREEWYVEQCCRVRHPVSLWLDDDLRNGIWKPDACFCDRCLAAFNAETGRSVDRRELVARLFGGKEVDDIRSAWFDFNARSLALFAAAARRGADRADPSVQLCLQSAGAAHFYSGTGRRAALWELSGRGRHQTGIRCGSGYYSEFAHPRDLLRRLLHVGREAARCRAYGDWIGSVTYENETYTHQVLNKTWEASLKENALALAVGCDAVTMYWYDGSRAEPMELFDEFARHLAAWRPYYERLSSVSRRTSLGGVARRLPENFRDVLPDALRTGEGLVETSHSVAYSFEHPMDREFALYGIPVTVAEAKPQAFYTPADRWVGKGHENNPTTAEIEKLRDLFDARSSGAVPVRLGKAHPLVVWPRVDPAGRLVAVTFFNCSLGRATGVPARLRNPAGARLTWMSGELPPRELTSRPGTQPGELVVTLPEIPGFDLGTIFLESPPEAAGAGAKTALPVLPTEEGRAISLDGKWRFSLQAGATNDAVRTEGEIDVPSNWEMRGFGTPLYDERISGEVGVYRRTFAVPDAWPADCRVFLRFDGVMFGAVVSVNGRNVGDFTSSFNAHVLDVTDALRRTGDNELIVRTHGHPKGAEFDTNDDWTLHGIHRSVTLFTLPKTHVRCWRMTSSVHGRDATVRVTTELSQPGRAGVRLLSPQGAEVAAGEGTNVTFTIRDADLWTAETPSLYTLEISVFPMGAAGCPVQRLVRRVGLREVTWSDGILRLNGRPIELRGVNHHDLSPVNGRAMTAAEQRRDVELIRAANCNFIRTSHYPPSEALLDACDELGVYVMDEVPFGGGKKLVFDPSYGDCLRERARLTVERDANRASVIAWSVGNEQKVTPITVAALREVGRLDPSRPTCFPQQPDYFKRHTDEKGMAEQGDLLDWHYPLIVDPEERMPAKWFARFDRPFVSGEFAHANGLDFGYLEDYLRLVRATPSYAGGAVWMFQDQGIVRKPADIPSERRRSCVVTRDGIWYDTYACEGTDGIVYADRTPQSDYAELRQVYSPVEVRLEDVKGGGNGEVAVVVASHYDFVPLDGKLVGKWRVVSDRKTAAEGALDLKGIPARGMGRRTVAVPKADGVFQWLEVSFSAREDGRIVYVKTWPLGGPLGDRPLPGGGPLGDRPLPYQFALDDATGVIRLADAENRVLIDGVPLVRTDRRRMLGKDFSYARFAQPWSPKVLAPKSVRVRERTANRIVCDYVYAPTNVPTARIDAEITVGLLSDRVRIAYALVQNADRKVFETGLAFAFRQPEVRFEWVGLGPYETYPGTTALSNFGIWSLDARDLRFVGNRHETRLLRICLGGTRQDAAPAGGRLAVVPVEGTDFAFERVPDEDGAAGVRPLSRGGALLGVNAVVGRKGCRFALPYDIRTVRAGERLTGAFDLVPQASENAAMLDRAFGSVPPREIFQPFERSYDQ